DLHEPLALDLDGIAIAEDPLNRVEELAPEVPVVEAPEGSIHVAGQVGEPRLALLLQHNRRQIGGRLSHVDRLGRIGGVRIDESRDWIRNGCEWNAPDWTGNPFSFLKAGSDGVALMNLLEMDGEDGLHRFVLGALAGPGLADAKEMTEGEVRAWLSGLIIEAGLEGGEKRPALLNVLLERMALGITQQRDVRENERGVAIEVLVCEILLMNEVKGNAGLSKHGIHALNGVGLRFVGRA